MEDTELLINCSNKQTAERILGPRDVIVNVQAERERRQADALVYLKARAQTHNAPLTTEDLREVLALLGVE